MLTAGEVFVRASEYDACAMAGLMDGWAVVCTGLLGPGFIAACIAAVSTFVLTSMDVAEPFCEVARRCFLVQLSVEDGRGGVPESVDAVW